MSTVLTLNAAPQPTPTGGLMARVGAWLGERRARRERDEIARHLLEVDDASLASYGIDRNQLLRATEGPGR